MKNKRYGFDALATIFCLLAIVSGGLSAAVAGEATVGNIRVQALSPTLVRIEQKGPKGFENRTTLTVVDRDWTGLPLKAGKKDGNVLLVSPAYQIEIPENAKDLIGITLRDASGKMLHTISEGDLKIAPLSAPGAMPPAWILPDIPRLVPSEWGATVPPASCVENKETSGWELANQAADLYVFIPASDNYAAFRQEFLKLTGPVPLVPLYTFGLWFSRYYPYTAQNLLDLTDEFRERGFPFDLMVADTDWRVGASVGYAVNKKLFPDMAGYIAKAHEKNVRTMFNDHPEPQVPGPLDPKELAYREEGLDSLLDIGADVWWYDKNWPKKVNAPNGLTPDFWGTVIFYDITLKNRPERRPLIMSNVDGMWAGMQLTPNHPAMHRYPVWIPGDTLAIWHDFRAGIRNGVNAGITALMAYINEDVGGHMFQGTPELYTRWFAFSVFSPVCRMHSYPEAIHHPWAYGGETEAICRQYAQLRYRMLPTIYAAARRIHDDGTPLLRRCDLEWPGHPEAADSLQYLFGDDLLVAPQCYNGLDPLPPDLLKTPDGKPGIHVEYYDNDKLEGEPKLARTEPELFYDWKVRPKKIPIRDVSVRWTGTLGPIKETAEYEFCLPSKDGATLWVDGNRLIHKTEILKNRKALEMTTARMKLKAGKSYPIKVEFFGQSAPECTLFFGRADEIDDTKHQSRPLWIPPGRWQDAWTGEVLEGPKTVTVVSDLEHLPLYVREGGMIFTTPLRMSSGTPVWDKLTVDAFVPESGTTSREIYEDDGFSNGYLKKEFNRTRVVLNTEKDRTTLTVEPSAGGFLPRDFKRDWTVRLHIPAGKTAAQFSVNGKAVRSGVNVLKPAGTRVFPFTGPGAAPGMKSGDVVEFSIPGCPADQALTVDLTLKSSVKK